IDKDVFARYTSDRPSWYYEVVAPGYKYNMTDIAASIGIHQLKRAYDFQKKRESIAKFYSENLFGLPLILPATANAGDCHAWHLYVVRLADSAAIERDSFIKEMFSNGIGCSVHFIPLHLHPYWRMKYKLLPEDFPEATQAFQKSISLPIFSKMTIEDCGKVVQTITSILKK
ncbi:MAG: DegT/DnrJ/EryC1/StrS family aminotransferase, partial [Deltaproteobacteria bacterium]|nr:DegT/DnrJ/EryC1/StrS family aminotransferase [Deltaproteobacteria bacterium]